MVPGIGQDGAVGAASQDDAQPGRHVRIDDHAGRVDPRSFEGVDHEAAEDVGADLADDGGAQAEARGAAGEDCRRAADDQAGIADQLLHLAEDRRHVAGEDEIGVDLTDGHDVEASACP